MPSAFRRAGVKTPAASRAADDATASPSPTPTTTTTPFSSLRGVKPWQGGSYLTSVGLNDLDAILGGGQPLQTCILLEEDRWTRDLALSLVKYWCAEAVSQDHLLLAPVLTTAEDEGSDDDFLGETLSSQAGKRVTAELESTLSSLPRNLHWDKHKKKAADRQANEEKLVKATDGQLTQQMAALDILEEGENEEDQDDEESFPAAANNEDEGLVVAWQYKKSVQQERLAAGNAGNTNDITTDRNVFCHSYDLSGRMSDQEVSHVDPFSSITMLPPLPIAKDSSHHQRGITLFKHLTKAINDKLSSNHNKALRLLLYHPSIEEVAVALPLLLAHIRKEALPVIILICTPPTKDINAWIQLARTCEAVLSTEGFASRKEYPPPPEFRHLQGVLKISKTTRKPTEIAALVYGFKRDRRKLHIQLLHIPPEDYAEGGGSVGAGGVRSGAGRPTSKTESAPPPSRKVGAGMGCSSNLSGSALDF